MSIDLIASTSISVVIAFGPDSVAEQRTLDVLVAETAECADAELLLVDDRAGGATRAVLRTLTGPVRVIHHLNSLGRGAALRRAISVASGEIVVLLAAPADLARGALAEIVERFAGDPGLGLMMSAGDAAFEHLLAIRREALLPLGGPSALEPGPPVSSLATDQLISRLKRFGWRVATLEAGDLAPASPEWPTDPGQFDSASDRYLWSFPPLPDRLHSGINVVGLLDAACGVGDAARRYVDALATTGIEYTTHSFHGHRSAELPYVHHDEERVDLDTNLVVLNPEVLGHFAAIAGNEFWQGRYTIGVWYWEVEELAAAQRRGLGLVNELWASSTFMRDAFAAATEQTVLTIPLPVRERIGRPSYERRELGLPEHAFTFLSTFDFGSLALRKNSIGVVRAFCGAFAPDEGPVLVLKTMNASWDPRSFGELTAEIGARRDVLVLDGCIGDQEISALIGSADCYVSLHRSEGFGLTPAEAMAWGRPVIATAYSANLDFMNDHNSYLVDYDLVPVDRRVGGIYPPTARWAEPRHENAVATMRYVYEHQEEAAGRGEVGRAEIRQSHGVATVAAMMADRFAVLAEHRRPLARTSSTSNRPPLAKSSGARR